jgi:mRNA-degrading endonuclease RelE of RelBE toxin-antitoxin system
MPWTVTLHREVAKGVPTLPQPVQDLVRLLLLELEGQRPVRGNWPNYGKLSRTRHHCHLKKGRPTYVAVWNVRDSKQRLIEVIYVGTHEKAPYG